MPAWVLASGQVGVSQHSSLLGTWSPPTFASVLDGLLLGLVVGGNVPQTTYVLFGVPSFRLVPAGLPPWLYAP